MDPLLWLALAALVAALLVYVSFVKGRGKKKKEKVVAAATTGTQGAAVIGGSRRSRNVRARMAAVQRARARATQDENGEEDDEEGEGEGEMEEGLEELDQPKFTGKIGTKKLRKIQEKAEKRAMREQTEALREDRKRREALREEERKAEEEEERIQREKEEEEQKRQREEQERREHEEYLLLKETFAVEEEGEAAEEEGEDRGVRDFIDYIKNSKVVYLEDLAVEFNMKTQDAIQRVQSLQGSGELSGVVDDRGKFIYISQEELEAVARFIRQRGRVSITDLVNSSNILINLQPDIPVDVH